MTWKEAQVFYANWKHSTPLQRIQIQPRLPDELCHPQYQRTEKRGIQMLLKAIPAAEQQALVTDRALSSTAILYKLLVRFQPGGPGEKQILLQQLTTLPKASTVVDLAANLRNWRRHFGRALEVDAALPDGVLLLKALDGPIQQLGALDPQAGFRLSQSRMQLGLDERPTQEALWSYSQCLLAEAETLCLLQTQPEAPATPLKLKQLNGGSPDKGKPSPDGKQSTASSTAEKPCKYFISDSGCKAGKGCKWLHSWEGVTDKASRCWICGGKDHKKSACTNNSKGKRSEPAGSGGGRGGSSQNSGTTSSTMGGKAGAAAQPSASTVPGLKEMSGPVQSGQSTTTTTDTSSTTTNSEAPGSDKATDGSRSAELLEEATKLLKSLRVSPQIKMIKMSILDIGHGDQWVLLDSGATHALRPAVSDEEWENASPAQVTLADGITSKLRLKPETKVLVSDPHEASLSNSWIVPLGGVTELGYKFEWKDGRCSLRDERGVELDVLVKDGCPMIPKKLGFDLINRMEQYNTIMLQRMVLVKALMDQPHLIDDKWSAEIALMVKLRNLFPQLPEEIMTKVVPDLTVLHRPDFGEALPWNRHKRRRLQRAKHVVLHVFSGDSQKFWEKKLNSATTETLCVDIVGNITKLIFTMTRSLHTCSLWRHLVVFKHSWGVLPVGQCLR